MRSISVRWMAPEGFHSNNKQKKKMKSYNHIVLKGGLGRDAAVREVADRRVANFSVATEYNFKKKDGNFDKEVTWVDVVAWEGFGIADFDLLKKGAKVYVSGRLRKREYTGNDGQTHTVLEVLADEVDCISEKPRETANARPQGSRQYNSTGQGFGAQRDDVSPF